MSAERNRAIVERMYERFNRKDVEPLEECVAPQLVLHTTLLTNPRGGIADLRQLFAMVRHGFPDARVTLEQVVAEGDVVAVRFLFSGTNLGEMRGNAATGRAISWQENMFFRLQDERIHEIWHLINVMEVLEKLGSLPSEHARERIARLLNVSRKLGRLIGFGRG